MKAIHSYVDTRPSDWDSAIHLGRVFFARPAIELEENSRIAVATGGLYNLKYNAAGVTLTRKEHNRFLPGDPEVKKYTIDYTPTPGLVTVATTDRAPLPPQVKLAYQKKAVGKQAAPFVPVNDAGGDNRYGPGLPVQWDPQKRELRYLPAAMCDWKQHQLGARVQV